MRYGCLTLLPHFLVPSTVTGNILGALLLLRLLLIAAKHVLEEVELGMGDRNQKKEGQDGLKPIL